MKRKTKQQLATILTLAMTIGLCQTPDAVSAATIKLNKKKLSIAVGKTATLKLKGTKKRAKWTVKSGKKYIKLKAKKKASVKVYGVRKGTAKVQCKVGKKKLLCKVTVKAGKKVTVTEMPSKSGMPEATATPAISAMPVVTPTVVPTAEPTPAATHPYEAYKLITMQTPGPVAEYDRLKVETLLCKERVVPVYGGPATYGERFFETDMERADIEKITLSDAVEIPENALGTIDVSEKGNGSVMAWYVDADNDGYYEMTIGQDGGVVANADSSYLFSYIGEGNGQEENTVVVEGLENLDTSHVVDMSYMFTECAYAMEILDFKDGIDVSNVTNAEGMFLNAGNTHKLRCYTTDKGFFDWLRSNLEVSGFGMYMNNCGVSDYNKTRIANIILGESKNENQPTRAETEDCIMIEPQVVITESGTVEALDIDINSYVDTREWKLTPPRMYFFGSSILREDIEFMTITDKINIPQDVLGTIDISEAQNQSVIAWYTDQDNDGKYEMYIGQDGGVVANRDSSFLFYGIGRNASTDHPEGKLFEGFDYLYIDSIQVTNYMFACCGDSTGGFKKMDLGKFPRYWCSVDFFYDMFSYCGTSETVFYMPSDTLSFIIGREGYFFEENYSDRLGLDNFIPVS